MFRQFVELWVLVLIGAVVTVVSVPAAGASSSGHACRLLSRQQAVAILGGPATPTSVSKRDCSYTSLSQTNRSGQTLPIIYMVMTTSASDVHTFKKADNPSVRAMVHGRIPSGVTLKELQPHRLRLDGAPSYYVGPLPANETRAGTPDRNTTFAALIDGTVVHLGLEDVPGTQVRSGKQAMSDILVRLRHRRR